MPQLSPPPFYLSITICFRHRVPLHDSCTKFPANPEKLHPIQDIRISEASEVCLEYSSTSEVISV